VVDAIAGRGVGVDVSTKFGAVLADVGVGAEQEVDKRISNAQNTRCRGVVYRLMNYIVSENIFINTNDKSIGFCTIKSQ